MATGTSLFYNGVQINNCKTLLFEQTAQHDDSGTDPMYWDYRIAVEGIIVANATAPGFRDDSIVGTYGAAQGSTAQHVAIQAFNLLKEHRGHLIYTMNGVQLLNSANQVDANNGPRPQHVKLVGFTPNSYRVQFEIVASFHGCKGAIISNRWSCADSVDSSFRTTRVWRGKIRVAEAPIDPHDFRGLSLPPIIKGWKRRAMHFIGEPNGLELTYEVVDEEMLGDSPPDYSISMSGTHTEKLTLIAETTTSEMSVRLDGPPKMDKRFLFQQALAVLDNRLHFENFVDPSKAVGIFRSLTLVDHFGQDVCAVEAHAVVQRFNDQTQQGFKPLGNAIIDKLGAPFDFTGYDTLKPVFPSAYPASFANLFNCYLQQPCGPHFMPGGTQPEPEDDDQQGPEEDDRTEATYDPVAATQDIPEPQYTEEQKAGMFVHCEAQSEYIVSDGTIGCPIAGVAASDPSLANIRVAPRTAKRIITLEIERLGTAPEAYNAAEFTDRNGIIHWPKQSRYRLRPPTQTGDGQTLYTLDQKLIFALHRAPTLGEMSMSSLPWLDKQPENLPATGRDGDQL